MTRLSTDSDLRDYLTVVIRRWKLVLAMPALAIVAAVLVGLIVKPVYAATATIVLAPATLSIPTANQVPPYYLMVDSPRRLPTAYTPAYYVALLKSAEVVSAVAPQAPVSISANVGDKSLIEIAATSDDPNVAAQTANTWARAGAARIAQILSPGSDEVDAAQQKLDAAEQALVKFSQDNALGDYNLAKLRAASFFSTEKNLELARLLRARDNAEAVYNDFARDFGRAAILAASALKPTTIAAPVPTEPVSPKWAQNIAVAAGLGLLIGILGAFAAEYVTRKP
ncbi:MAG: hypothetical protein HY782_08005 [Chloroflexi bacterium]|nr:hypothetical protein [Chloroflexota bacterium]